MARRGVFDYDTLTPALKRLLPVVDAAVDLVFDLSESEAESYARANAPWHDNTGNARAGLGAVHEPEPMVVHRLTIYHTMDYGYWLEVRWSGRYAIIGPTMYHMAEVMAGNLAGAIRRAIGEMG